MSVPGDVLRGARLFNARAFFEAHEAWEDHWGHGPPDERQATLGLVKVAVALHHLEARNVAGFAWQAEKAVEALRAASGVWPELDLPGLAEAVDSLAAQVRFHRRVPDAWAPPTIPLPEAP